MDSAAELHGDHDVTDVPSIVRGAVLPGPARSRRRPALLAGDPLPRRPGRDHRARAVLLLAGSAGVTLLPGIWTRARTIEGIAGAAGIGLGATVVFLLVDVALLQHIGTYTNRW